MELAQQKSSIAAALLVDIDAIQKAGNRNRPKGEGKN